MPFGTPNVEKLKAKGDLNGLLKALRHKDWQIRNAAGEALGSFGHPGVSALLETLRRMVAIPYSDRQEGDKHAEDGAAHGLRGVADPAAVDFLLDALAQPGDGIETRWALLSALGNSGRAGDPRVLAVLTDRLFGDVSEQASAAEALGTIGGDDAVAALRKAVRTGAGARTKALAVLEAMGVGVGDDLSPEEAEAVETARTETAIEERLRQWKAAVGGDACTCCGGKTGYSGQRVPVYDELLTGGFVCDYEANGLDRAPAGASRRDMLGYAAFCRPCAERLARFALDLEAGRVAPSTARAATPSGRTIEGILVIAQRPIEDERALLQQIADEHRAQGDAVAAEMQGRISVAGDSVDDEYFALGALWSDFPQAKGEGTDRVRRLTFQATDGNRGFYYLVFAEPPLRPSSYAELVSDPVCPQCSTVYDRAEVVRLLRERAPEMFDSPLWSTRFRCLQCGAEVPVSGAGDVKQD